jgi:AcrR family transcriptional regulator
MTERYQSSPPEGTDASTKSADPATRRRGAALERAIFGAVFDQLEAVGYAKLTMEGVATAARTGKAALYRRWTDRDDLVLDAVRHALPMPAEVPLRGSVRDDILALLHCQLAAIEVTKGFALQVKSEGTPKSGLLHALHRERVSEPIRKLILEVLAHGAERGEVRPEAVSEQMARVGPAMLVHYCVTEGPDVPGEYLTSLVDDVILPLVRTQAVP